MTQNRDELALTKFDILEAFEDHKDLAVFLEERIRSQKEAKEIK